MLTVDFKNNWDINDTLIIKGLNEAIKEINEYINYRKCNNYNDDLFKDMYLDFAKIVSYWVGNTYVGCEKNPLVVDIFDLFFATFMKLLLFLKESTHASPLEQKLYCNALYSGKLYRYIGNGDPLNIKQIDIRYDNKYVSWTKKPKVSYLEGKFYGDYYIITAQTDVKQYGIDIHTLGIGREFEGEVIFPTIEKNTLNIKTIRKNN